MILLQETQQQDPILLQIDLGRDMKHHYVTPNSTMTPIKRIFQNYCRFQNLRIKESFQQFYFIQETPTICLPLFLLLVIFYIAQTNNLSGYPGREKSYASITHWYHRPKIKAWTAIFTQDCLDFQTGKRMPNFLMSSQEPFPKLQLHLQRMAFPTLTL